MKMRLDEVRKVAEQVGIKPGRMRKADLIRAIQQAEGNQACYATGHSASCGQTQCCWRDDCH